jgi:hypothetical protein
MALVPTHSGGSRRLRQRANTDDAQASPQGIFPGLSHNLLLDPSDNGGE